jgi:hypothetical protein
MKLAALAAGLARLDLDAIANATLGSEANRIGEAVREALSHTPGERATSTRGSKAGRCRTASAWRRRTGRR